MSLPLAGKFTITGMVGGWGVIYFFVFLYTIPFICPVVLMMLCMVYQCYTLLKPNIARKTTRNQRKITVTIFQITLLCFICNLAFIVAFLNFYISEKYFDNIVRVVLYITSTFLPFINAGFHPVILIYRGNALQTYVNRKVFMFIDYCCTCKGSRATGNAIRIPKVYPKFTRNRTVQQISTTL